MKRLFLTTLIITSSLLSSCGNDSSGANSAGDAPTKIKESVRARLPLYYVINNVNATTSSQTVAEKTFDVSQLAIEVTLNEDLYTRSDMTQALQDKLKNATQQGFGGFGINRGNKQFIKKVASKGESKTLYGELVTTALADGKINIEDFSIKDASGSTLSEFNSSEIIIVSSEEEKAYVNSLIAKADAKKKAEQDRKDKMLTEKKQLEAEKQAKIAADKNARKARFQARKKEAHSIFKEGNSYQGVFKSNTAEKLELIVESFDPELQHGVIKLVSQEVDYAVKMKFSFSTFNNRDETYMKLTGKTIESPSSDRDIQKKSLLANKGRYFSINKYSISESGIVSVTLNSGVIIFKK